MFNIKQKLSKSTALLTAAVLVTTLSMTACGSNEHEEVHAVDKVEEASDMARANAPEAEVLDLEVTEPPAATADTNNADSAMLDDAVTSEGVEAETEDMAVETEEGAEASESETIEMTNDTPDTDAEVADEEGTIVTE